MPKKVIYLIIIALLSLLIWVYRSSKFEYNDTILMLRHYNYFRKTLNKPISVCNESPFLVIIVTSYVGHVELRSAHRRAMPVDHLVSLNITRIFLLATIPISERYITQESINDESKTFNDILQGSFYENYRNLTYKHLMGLEWASRECHKTSYILKVDDDTVFNLKRTYEYLKTLPKEGRSDLIMGYILNNTVPRRNKMNKWYVTYEEYPRSIYPPYLSGWYYIISPKVASLICDEAMYNSFFWIDDIFVTGLLIESLGLKLRQIPNNYWLEYYEQLECCLRDMINKSIKCDYVIGPNGGRSNLIVEFNEAYTNCEKWRNCTVRSKDLKKQCILSGDRTIFSDGHAEVDYVKI